MGTISSNLFFPNETENLNQNNNELLQKEHEYNLIKDNLTYTIIIKNEVIETNNTIKIKTSQIINKTFYLYEQIIDNKYLNKIFNNDQNFEYNFFNFIKIFDHKKAIIKDILIDKEIILDLEINSINNIGIKLLKSK